MADEITAAKVALAKPTASRGEGNRSMKLDMKRQGYLDESKEENIPIIRMFSGSFYLNGVQYCRPHLMIECHLCEITNMHVYEEVNKEREQLGLRPGGDPYLDNKALRWADEIRSKQLRARLEIDIHRQMNPSEREMPKEKWGEFMQKKQADERDTNERFLKEVQETFEHGASQCCYWACQKPKADKLFKCTGCGIAKYCSKEHQKADWAWEHKGECTAKCPSFILREIEEDRQRNLQGDYSLVER